MHLDEALILFIVPVSSLKFKGISNVYLKFVVNLLKAEHSLLLQIFTSSFKILSHSKLKYDKT